MRSVCVIILLIVPIGSYAQKEATHWYFGQNAGLSFANGAPQVLLNGALNTIEGSASISDRSTGELLFYTDGETVWNRDHDQMENGFDLNGHWSSTQSALIMPAHWSDNQYYIFTTDNASFASSVAWTPRLSYSIVDMNGDSGLGSVVQKNILLIDSTGEKQAAAPHCNGSDYWIVTHHMTRNEFYAFRVSRNGVDPIPIVSTVGMTGGFNAYGIGYLKFSPNGKMIAVAGIAQQLFDFDNATGIVSNARTVTEVSAQYGVTFSPDNSKLYLIGRGLGLFQYDLSQPDEQSIQASEELIFEGDHRIRFGALQIGPDNKIYVSMNDALGVIRRPNSKGLACDFRSKEIFLEGRRSSLGLPNFMDAWFNAGVNVLDCFPPISAFEADTVLCQDDSLHVRDISTGQPSAWKWTFEGGIPQSFQGQSPPPVRYPTPGVFTVTLETMNSKDKDISNLKVTVLPRPVVDAGPDITLCSGEQTELQASGANSYLWEPAASLSNSMIADPIATPLETTEYIVTGTNEFGCIDRDTVLVRVERSAALVNGDTALCAGEAMRLQASGGAEYSWSPDTYLDDPLSPTPLLSPPENAVEETITYTVQVSSGECTSTATVNIRIRALPTADAGPDTATCAGAAIRLQATGGEFYSWTPDTYLDDPLSPTPLLTPPADAPEQTVVYTVRATSGECASTASISVFIHALPAVDAGSDVTKCPDTRIQLSGSGDGTLLWTPAESLDDPTSPTPFATPTETTVYRLTVTDANGCTAFDEVTVTINSTLDLAVRAPDPICAGDSVQLFAEGASAYRWEPAEYFRDPTVQNPWVAPTTNQRFTVHGSDGGCEGSAEVDVIVLPAPNGFAGPDTTICAGEVVLLRAGGGVSYEWTPKEGLSDPFAAHTEAYPERTTAYGVKITDANGCSATMHTQVEVLPHKEITLEVERIDSPATPGERIALGIVVRGNPDALAQADIDSVILALSYDVLGLGYEDTAIRTSTAAPGWQWQAEERPNENLLILRGSGPPLVAEGALCAVPLRVFLSNHRDLFSEIDIVEAQAFGSGACYDITTGSDGGIRLSPFCLSESRPIALTGAVFRLNAPQPNPATEIAEISYSVGLAGHTRITIYSALGELVQTIADQFKDVGEYSATINGLPSGAYYCTMVSGPFRATQRLFILH